MKSMTGYGFAEVTGASAKTTVEISSVNKKGLDLYVNLPREFSALENEVREIVQKEISRGKVVVNFVVIQQNGKKSAGLPINEIVLRKHHKDLTRIARSMGVSDDLPLSFLIGLPGVMLNTKPEDYVAKLKPQMIKTLQESLKKFQACRQREGQFLSRHLVEEFAKIEKSVAKVSKTAPQIIQRYKANLVKRMGDSGIALDSNDERVIREVAFFADRADISEEITRLTAHLKEAKRLLSSNAPAGRNLDFLLQEINREVNTTGSKANGLEISKLVITMKADLEKIREQVQNLE